MLLLKLLFLNHLLVFVLLLMLSFLNHLMVFVLLLMLLLLKRDAVISPAITYNIIL